MSIASKSQSLAMSSLRPAKRRAEGGEADRRAKIGDHVVLPVLLPSRRKVGAALSALVVLAREQGQ